ncbi:hypothetical protein CJ030_MR5G009699 [Morella rubra]|uniref:Uncharacterized protein n=1 Tax=Morella rubra TaxID=262757 RepID=A0A6A1VL56_9ROSI|nr:hypothetical protein CJ030_MR5G009699 [Morella rubra]
MEIRLAEQGPQDSNRGLQEGQGTWSDTSSGGCSGDTEFSGEVVGKGQQSKMLQGQEESPPKLLDPTVLGLSNVLGKLLSRTPIPDAEYDNRVTKAIGPNPVGGSVRHIGLNDSPSVTLEALDGMVTLKREGAAIPDSASLLKKQRDVPVSPKLLVEKPLALLFDHGKGPEAGTRKKKKFGPKRKKVVLEAGACADGTGY